MRSLPKPDSRPPTRGDQTPPRWILGQLAVAVTTAVSGAVVAYGASSWHQWHSVGQWSPQRYSWVREGGDPALAIFDAALLVVFGGLLAARAGQFFLGLVARRHGHRLPLGRVGWWDVFLVVLPVGGLWHLIWVSNTNDPDPLWLVWRVLAVGSVAWAVWRVARRGRADPPVGVGLGDNQRRE